MSNTIDPGGSWTRTGKRMMGPDNFRAADHFYGAQLSEQLRTVARRSSVERHRFINGVFVHEWKVKKYDPDRLKKGHFCFARRAATLWAEYERKTELLGEGPWPQQERIIIDCRNFALLDASLQRSVGVATRIRNGFANYLGEKHLQDHWIVERWEGYRWIMDDPDIQRSDLSDKEFIPGVRAWTIARKDPLFAAGCGFGPDPSDRGLWAIRLDAVHDLNALFGKLAVSGDSWGLGAKKEEEVSSLDLEELDGLCSRAQSGDLSELPPDIEMGEKIVHYDYLGAVQRELSWAEAG